MFGLFDWLKLGAGAVVGAIVAGAVAWQLGQAVGEKAGRDAEQAAARTRALELIAQRNHDNAEISTEDIAGLCS
jgi:hypothetical protein